MYFKKLELIGFKSFCDKTTLHFEPGITAVVGPNGTGKSNIFDSIRWVLGEQSAKSLRGSEMQDVIFNGTDQKEQLGMAEVTLTFDNKKMFFNFDHPELAITRRIFRSGESEYLLNKTPVRLKDILDLLLGTGIGSESYSIVAQGKIDLILSLKAEDRRLVFDEAAGITKYKAQKRETARRLEETEQNLLRVCDIITEVKRQIASLERQATKARRYKEVFEELKTKEINLSLLQKKEIFKQRDEIIRQLSELESKESSLLNLLEEQEDKISCRQTELKAQEENISNIKNQLLNLENLFIRNNEHIGFNKERIEELREALTYLEKQLEQGNVRLVLDDEKLKNIKTEYDNLKLALVDKKQLLTEKEAQLNELNCGIKNSLDNISKAKIRVVGLATDIANGRNEISALNAKQQIYSARKKRLEIERAKANEERLTVEGSLNRSSQEVEALKKTKEVSNLKISEIKEVLGEEAFILVSINSDLASLEKERLTLESHKEFLEKLKTKYQDIGESMNAIIYLDKAPVENVSGLVIKVRDYLKLSAEDKSGQSCSSLKLSGEAKPIELDTQNLKEKINKLEEKLVILKEKKNAKETHIQGLKQGIEAIEQELHELEIALANKELVRLTILGQFNKLKEEEEIITIELDDAQKEISAFEKKLEVSSMHLSELDKEQGQAQDLIQREEGNISLNSKLREEVLMLITQTKTELEAVTTRFASYESTLKVLEATLQQDKETTLNLKRQLEDSLAKKESLEQKIRDSENKTKQLTKESEFQNKLLMETQSRYKLDSKGVVEEEAKIESDRIELNNIRNKLYQLKVENKDIDYRFASIKERMLQAYKIDLETLGDVTEEFDARLASQEITQLKEKLDSYGTVNLVAIEEYEELKKRYDFLNQQQNDLLSAKDSLNEAIRKINRTTKQMFLETFEQVRQEFRNYFRLLFNGGDAQVFLIDEQDPLESGIEIICRPPGRKLQNVLLLSGGEKSLSAIALIFAIFKVKPSPFCILDEIDAALDEANVDRFSKTLQEFAKESQFIVITHNKRTIANADVMYGITMQESGVSKIVSVKLAKDSLQKETDKEAVAAAA